MKRKRKRSRAVAFLLIPFAVFLWCIGWSMYWVGSKHDGQHRTKTHILIVSEVNREKTQVNRAA